VSTFQSRRYALGPRTGPPPRSPFGAGAALHPSREDSSMPDPVSRLQFAQQEIDRVLGAGFAVAHPELVAIVVQTGASDWAASR
jgi:hypothetical protein